MARIARVRDDIPVGDIKKHIKGTSDGIFRLRLMIIEKLISEPKLSLQDVADMLIVNRETVTRCLQLFNGNGIDALKPKKAGRKEGNPKYDAGIFRKLYAHLQKNDEKWSVYQMQEWIFQEFQIKVPESTIYHRMTKMGHSFKSAPKRRQAN